MQQIILLVLFGIYAIEDIRKKTISVQYLPVFALAGVCIHLYLQDMTVIQMMFGMLLGLGILGVSWITEESIGIGDGILLIVSGIFLGGVDNFELLCISLLYTALFSLLMLMFGICKKNQEIPFVPFLFLAYITMIFM